MRKDRLAEIETLFVAWQEYPDARLGVFRLTANKLAGTVPELLSLLRASQQRTAELEDAIGHALDEMSGGKHWDAEEALTRALSDRTPT